MKRKIIITVTYFGDLLLIAETITSTGTSNLENIQTQDITQNSYMNVVKNKG